MHTLVSSTPLSTLSSSVLLLFLVVLLRFLYPFLFKAAHIQQIEQLGEKSTRGKCGEHGIKRRLAAGAFYFIGNGKRANTVRGKMKQRRNL